jgi:hypothetical protein
LKVLALALDSHDCRTFISAAREAFKSRPLRPAEEHLFSSTLDPRGRRGASVRPASHLKKIDCFSNHTFRARTRVLLGRANRRSPI